MGPPMLPRPTKPTGSLTSLTRRSLRRAGPLILGETLARRSERLDARRNPCVDRRLQQHFLDLLLGAPVPQRAHHMQLELVLTIERREHRDIEKAARLARQALPSPNGAPAVLGH